MRQGGKHKFKTCNVAKNPKVGISIFLRTELGKHAAWKSERKCYRSEWTEPKTEIVSDLDAK